MQTKEKSLYLLSGGAAFGLVQALGESFRSQTGYSIAGAFSAVGVMRDRLLAGERADVLILTRALIEGLVASGHVRTGSLADVGSVQTALAVRTGQAPCAADDGPALRASLLAADAIYFPDPKLATAGIHFARVLDKLGIAEAVADRLRPHPNGAAAMAAMAAGADANPIGCTQVTEIMATPGVKLVAALPAGYDLSSIYTAGVAADSAAPEIAAALIALLCAPENAAARRTAGFDA